MENDMKTKFSRNLKAITAAALLSAAFCGPASALSPSDAWITTRAKVNLLTAEGVDAASVNVDTVNRQITLHGSVSNAAEKQKAEDAVRSVNGVSNVRNLLQVVPPGKEAAIERADAEINAEVTAALTRQASISDSSIKVESVNKGVVLLGGTAKDLTDHLTAVQTARNVKGVRRVASEIESSDQLADSMIWRDEPATARRDAPARAERDERTVEARAEDTGDSVNDKAKDAGRAVEDTARDAGDAVGDAAERTGNVVSNAARSTADAASDLYLTSMVKMRLLAEENTPAMDINVDTEDGKVTLFGMVPTAEAKAEAEAEARAVAGVSSVNNQLQVVADSRKPAVEAKDADVATTVENKLKERESLKDVSIDVKNCVVRLTGTVPSGEERVEAMQVARAQRGVCAVKNDLRIN
jgi:hyperosmotically inducible periplasmic protein